MQQIWDLWGFSLSPIIPNFKSQLCMVSDKALQAFMLQPNLTYGEPGRSASLAVPAEATLPLALGWKETRHIAWLEVQF